MDKFFDEAGRLCEQAQDDLIGFSKGFFTVDKLKALAIAVWAPLIAFSGLVLVAYVVGIKVPKPDAHWFDPITMATAPYFIAGILVTIWLRCATVAKSFGWTEVVIVFAGIGCLGAIMLPFWSHTVVVTIYFSLLFVADYHHANRPSHVDAARSWFRELATVLDKLLWVPALVLLLGLLAVDSWFPTLDDNRFGSPFWTGFKASDPTAFGIDRTALLHIFAGTQCFVTGMLFLLQLGKAPDTRD